MVQPISESFRWLSLIAAMPASWQVGDSRLWTAKWSMGTVQVTSVAHATASGFGTSPLAREGRGLSGLRLVNGTGEALDHGLEVAIVRPQAS